MKINRFVDRVDKLPVPLLVVGLGGAGRDAVLTVKKTFAERFFLPKDARGAERPASCRTAYLCFDCISRIPDGLKVSEYVDISLPGIGEILCNQQEMLTPFEQTWVNRDLRFVAGWLISRQEARLALSRNYEKVSQAIRCALTNIISDGGDSPVVEIAVVTSIGGGTGSGTFLDMCQILRKIASEVTARPVRLTGYIVMPDVSLANVSATAGMEDPIKRNAYAALKELDFWMRVREHQVPYSMEYGDGTVIQWTQPPFDTCILMSGVNTTGVPYRDGYMAVQNAIADSLFHDFAMANDVYRRYARQHRESVLAAMRIRKNYPLYYGYRAIGTFTMRIPKKSILYYEGSLLLKTFVPPRDDSGMLQPDRRMFLDGQSKLRAESITGNGPQLLQDFRTNVNRLPGFCNLDLRDKVKVTAVQNMSPPPHSKWHTWRDTVAAPAARKASENYLNKAWDRFAKWVKEIIADPAQGPFALEAYLDAPDGLLAYMQGILDAWTSQYKKTRYQSIAQGEEMCASTWERFRNPPMLGRLGALEQYDHAIKSLYTYVNNCEFLEKHTGALGKLILRVKDYLWDGLKPMCADILEMEKEFNTPEQNEELLVRDIENLAAVQNSIDATFADANADNRMSSEFLMKLAEITMQTRPGEDAKSSGVEFIGRRIGSGELWLAVQKELETVYGSVNNQSLDDIMVANVGTDAAAQQQWMDSLANSALDGALPMFMQDPVFASQTKAPYSCMSIPENATEHLKYITEAFKTHDPAVEPEASSLEDHIFVLLGWDKLPLLRYGLFESLRIAYDEDLKREGSKGLHLVRNGDPEADFTADWSQLPSPKPYFLFARNSVHGEEAQYERVHKLVEQGIACGMIKVRDDLPFVCATVNMICGNEDNKPLSCQDLMAKAAEITDASDPETGGPYDASEISARLKALLDSGRRVLLEQNEISPVNVANVLGLEHEPCDPFDPATRVDVIRLDKAKANYKKLCVIMVEAMIYSRPDLVRALELQLPAWQAINDKIGQDAGLSALWDKRNGFAETAARIFLYLNDRISLGEDGYKYRDKGTRYDMISASLLADDLKDMDSEILKTSCFLADVMDDNAIKVHLLHLLARARRDFDDAVDNEEITRDEMDDLMTAGKDLIDKLNEDQAAIERAIHENPGRKDELAHQVTMAEAIRKALESLNRNFKEILKAL